MNTAVKALNDSGRVGGYLVVFGSPAQKDLQGEYFTPDTELGLDWYDRRPVLYHHGLDGEVQASVVGTIDTLKADSTGVWAEAQLDMRHKYIAALRRLIEQGVLGWSSGSLAHLVITDNDGQIKRWPIVEGSMTPAPAEPRHTDINFIKSAYAELGLDITRLIPAEPDTPPAPEEPEAKEAAAVKSEAGVHIEIEVAKPQEEVRTMNPMEMILQLIDALLVAKPDWQLTPEEKQALAQQVAAGMEMPAEAEAMATALPEVAVPALRSAAAVLVRDTVTQHFARKSQAAAAQQAAAAKAMEDAMKAAPPVSDLPAFTGGVRHDEQRQRIEMRTKFAHMSPEDMSYYIKFRNALRKRNDLPPWTPDSAFMRELADKAGKAYDSGALRFGDENETTAALKSINFMKANELDHSTQSGYGDEWVPDLWSSQLWEKARLDNVIAPLFDMVEMSSSTYELPVESADPTVYFVPETTAESELTIAGSGAVIPDSKAATGKVQLVAKKLALRVGFSAELDEDSIIGWTAKLRQQAIRAMEDAIDNVLLNGDTETGGTGNVNLVDAAPAATAKYLALNGIRKLWLVTTIANSVDGGGAAITLAQIRAARFSMSPAYAAYPQNLAIIVPTEQYAKMLDMPEFLTMDVAGDRATARTGQIGVVDGIPVLVSNEYVKANSAGKVSNTGSNNTLGSLSIVYKPGWTVGYRRRVNATIDFLSYLDSYQLTSTVRLAFTNRDGEVAAGVYNSLV